MDFEQAIRAQLAGEIVRVSRLAEFRFKAGVQRYWPGHHVHVDTDGIKWFPTMGIGAVTGIAQSNNGSAPELRFELSGVDPAFIQKALGASEEYYGRLARVYWQFWKEDWTPLGKPKAITWGLMRSLVSVRRQNDGGTASSLILTAETPFEGRVRSRNGYLSDRDQKTRHPGDRICERIAGIEAKEVKFPDF